MDKNAYIKPEMMVEEMITENLMIATSANEYDTESADFQQRGNARRGTWGNLWNE